MPVCVHLLEELPDHHHYGYTRRFIETFGNSQALFGHIVHRDWFGSYIVKC